MKEINSKAYKALKKLSKHPDTRCLTTDESYWRSYLLKRSYTTHSVVEIAPKNGLCVEVINKSGRTYISDHKKKTFLSLLRWLIPIILTVAGLLIALLYK